jgi:membrane protein EpsK
MLTFKNAFFTPWYATKVLGISRVTFITQMLPGVFAMFIVAGLSYIVAQYLQISGFLALLVCGIVLTAVYLPVTCYFCLDNSERQTVESIIPFKTKKQLLFEIKTWIK